MLRAGLVLAFALGGAPASKAPAQAPAAEVHHVQISAMKFIPETVEVRVGDTVEWKNDDLVPHTIAGAGVASPVVNPGDTFRWTAEKAGELPYLCSLHPTMMKGSVVVTSSSASKASASQPYSK